MSIFSGQVSTTAVRAKRPSSASRTRPGAPPAAINSYPCWVADEQTARGGDVWGALTRRLREVLAVIVGSRFGGRADRPSTTPPDFSQFWEFSSAVIG
jgi:hypothetical protein